MSKRTETLHLYRSILRECTYLLDPASRKYVKSYAIERFRRHQLECANLIGRLKVGRNALSVLMRANEGHPQPLFKVLCVTYGRRGKRRRELLNKLTAGESWPPPKPDYIRKQIEKQFKLPPAALAHLPKLSPTIEALMKSQRAHSPPELIKSGLIDLAMKMPLKDIWERQLPFKRIKNKVKDWYASNLDRLLPPLPAEEWHRVAGFALGTTHVPLPVSRRPRAAEVLDSNAAGLGQWQDEQTELGFTTILEELGVKRIRRKRDYTSKPHHLTQRFVRRMYQRLFALCSMMSWNEEQQRPRFQWGREKSMEMETLRKNLHLLALFEADADEVIDSPERPPLSEPAAEREQAGERDERLMYMKGNLQ